MSANSDFSGFSLPELFRMEVETQTAVLTEGLLILERDPHANDWFEVLMRAAHSLKGAAQIVEGGAVVQITHAMEDCFVAAQRGELTLSQARIDTLLEGVDLVSRIAQGEDLQDREWQQSYSTEVNRVLAGLKQTQRDEARLANSNEPFRLFATLEPEEASESAGSATPPEKAPVQTDGVFESGLSSESNLSPESDVPARETTPSEPIVISVPVAPPELLASPELLPPVEPVTVNANPVATPPVPPAPVSIESLPSRPALPERPAPPERNAGRATESSTRALRVSSDNLNRLMGLAGELMVTSRWAEGFNRELERLKRLGQDVSNSLNELRDSLENGCDNEANKARLTELQNHQTQNLQLLSQRLSELEDFDRRFIGLSSRLYQEVLECRMRPFADGIQGFPRMVRDVARELGKKVQFEIGGEATLVDRDILERIEAPLGHLLRNAVDHGIEAPEKRLAVGKTESATIKLEAFHSAGMLLITVSDDGGGIELEAVRRAVVNRKLNTPEVAATLSEAELMEFLFLPGFSMKEGVTKISGRGVGLDAVQTMVREVGGTVRVSSQFGQGTQFQLQLPLTLSVIRALLVEIGGEPYAFPLARISGALKVPREAIETVQGRQHFTSNGQRIGLVMGHQILELEASAPASETLSVIVLGNKVNRYGIVIDRFLREQELVVRPLDPRLGKVQDISAAALLPDGSPILIVDVEDLVRSVTNLSSGGRLARSQQGETEAVQQRKRVLVVDDSLTVRELERKLLESRGYSVDVAVDGMDGWNAARSGSYDLVLTDVDMPRMDGIDLVKLIKNDARLQSLPVMIVSYKDREEDRRRGLDAGADYYLTKGSFHDESWLGAVADLIGEAHE